MSAVAGIIGKQGAVLLSDGLSFYHNDTHEPKTGEIKASDCKIHNRSTSKTIKINPHVGVQWVGNILPHLQKQLQDDCRSMGLAEPKEIAEHLSEMLKSHYGSDNDVVGTYRNVNISVVGFDKQNTPWGVNITCHPKRFLEPAAVQLGRNGADIMCQIPFVDEAGGEFNARFHEYYSRMRVVNKAAEAAFTEIIRDLESKDKLVGGTIFMENLRPY